MPTLNWIGKEKVMNHHLDVPYKILEHAYGFDHGQQSDTPTHSGNKIIHGDNLEALKSLLPEYDGRIKCIYIDPPYNTGNEGWVYNDNVNDPKMKKWLGEVVGKESEDLTRHDKWLCMMYPRLQVLNKLLAPNGALVMSIGYHEFYNVLLVCKEIFASKQVVCVTVQTSGGKPSAGFNYLHEYLIFVVPNDFDPNPLLHSGGIKRSPFEGLTLATFNQSQRPNQTYPIYVSTSDGTLAGIGESLQERIKNGTYSGNLEDFKFNYDEAPMGTVAVWPVTSKGKKCVWRLIPSRLKADWKMGYIKISPNNTNSENNYSIQYLPSGIIKKINGSLLDVTGSEPGVPTLAFGENKTVGGQVPTIWLDKSFYTVKGTTLLNELIKEKSFSYPKPLELISEVIRTISSDDDIVLDSFAGSGTTAHAVLNLNQLDEGNRKFILIEMEDYAESITAERVRRVINGYGDKEGTGGSFDYYELGQALFLENEVLNEEVPHEKLREYVWFSETKSPYCGSNDTEEYLLGATNTTAYYFYYSKEKVTTLDDSFLRTIRTKAEQYIIYADICLLDESLVRKYHIIFKKIPRDITRF